MDPLSNPPKRKQVPPNRFPISSAAWTKQKIQFLIILKILALTQPEIVESLDHLLELHGDIHVDVLVEAWLAW